MNKILFTLSFLFVGASAHAVDQVQMYSVKTTDAFQASVTQFVVSGESVGRSFRSHIDNQAVSISATSFQSATQGVESSVVLPAKTTSVHLSVKGGTAATEFVACAFGTAGLAARNSGYSFNTTDFVINGLYTTSTLTLYLSSLSDRPILVKVLYTVAP